MIRRFSSMGYLSAWLLPLSVVWGYYLGGWYNFITVGLVFILIPLVDQWNGTDDRLLGKEKAERLAGSKVHISILYAWVVGQLIFLIWAFFVFPMLSEIHEMIGFILGVGLVTGAIGITVAHEFGHKKSGLERAMSKFLLMMVCYMHFYIEHNKGHHVHVGTPEDPATARKNEGFYQFYFRTVIGSWCHAWALEMSRIRRNGLSWMSNKLIAYAAYPVIFCLLINLLVYLAMGSWYPENLLLFFTQSIIAFTLLELVNYVEHYGLKRKKLPGGMYEPVTEFHSWNSSHTISNYFLFQLQLHSDHHMNALKRYQVLEHRNRSPQLPAGYPMMILAALIPPLWYKVVHPILTEFEK